MYNSDFITIEKYIKKRLKAKCCHSILSFLSKSEISLWGNDEASDLVEKTFYATMYKELCGFGQNKIWNEIGVWYGHSHNTLSHNIKIMRKNLAIWGKSQIEYGDKKMWNRDAAVLPPKKNLKKINVLVDSSDFRLAGKRSCSRKKDPRWSHKLNAPGSRYMVAITLKGRILRVWGGYSPKVDDRIWCQMNYSLFDKYFKGAIILGDCHFTIATKLVEKCTVVTPIGKKVGRKKKNHEEMELPETTKANEVENKKLCSLRSRVEHPFAWAKNFFKTLQQPWFESEQDLDNLVYFAFGLRNLLLKGKK